jgi:predicted ATPase
MIRAKYVQHQRDCSKKWGNRAYFIEGITLKNIFNWSDSSISFYSPIVILTGKNGVGKSTFINALKFAFNIQEEKEECGIISSVESFQIVLVDRKGQEIVIEDGKILKQEFQLPDIIDMTFDTTLYSFFKKSSTEERNDYLKELEQYDVEYLPPDSLRILQSFIEKNIILAERIVDLEDFEDSEGESNEISLNEKKEYYRITLDNGTVYDSYTMGSGEFFLNEFLWGLQDLPKCSIVIIEELENYLHSEVQKKIIELVHELSHTNHIQFILTTHSPTIIDHVLRSSLVLIQYEISNVKITPNCPSWLAKDELGTTIRDKKIVLVEDEKAKSFLRQIISFNCPSLLNQIEITNCEGETKIEKIMKSINDVKLKNFIGVVDGDCTNQKILSTPHILKLPGNDVPEKIVVAETKANSKKLSEMILIKEDSIKQALELATTREDHHEWISKIARDLGQTSDSLWDSMIKIWYQNHSDESKGFFVSFYKEFQLNDMLT